MRRKADEAEAACKQAEEELERVRKEETAHRVNAYTCTHASTHVYMHANIHAHICTHALIYARLHARVYKRHVHIHTCAHTCANTHMNTHTNTHTCVYTHMHATHTYAHKHLCLNQMAAEEAMRKADEVEAACKRAIKTMEDKIAKLHEEILELRSAFCVTNNESDIHGDRTDAEEEEDSERVRKETEEAVQRVYTHMQSCTCIHVNMTCILPNMIERHIHTTHTHSCTYGYTNMHNFMHTHTHTQDARVRARIYAHTHIHT